MDNLRKPISFLATSRPEEARQFYHKTLDLEFVEEAPFALVFLDGGHMLRIQKLDGHSPAAHTAYGWQVANINAEIEMLSSKGIVFSRYEHLQQTTNGVWTSPDNHKIAWFADPDGNNLSLTEFAPGACDA